MNLTRIQNLISLISENGCALIKFMLLLSSLRFFGKLNNSHVLSSERVGDDVLSEGLATGVYHVDGGAASVALDGVVGCSIVLFWWFSQ